MLEVVMVRKKMARMKERKRTKMKKGLPRALTPV
jgi:hypothetical protein